MKAQFVSNLEWRQLLPSTSTTLLTTGKASNAWKRSKSRSGAANDDYPPAVGEVLRSFADA